MEQKILIIGAKGMLGNDLVEAFEDYDLTALDIEDLDITDSKQVEEQVLEIQPEIIINASGYTDVDGAEDNHDKAMSVNGNSTENLARAANHVGATLVYFSSEYVFGGDKKDGYDEESGPDPINAYGESKALGEEILQEECNKFYLIRSSWLYGRNPQVGKPRGVNFVDQMLNLATQGEDVKVVNDQFGCPTYTLDLVESLIRLIDNGHPNGIYHLVNEAGKKGVSWYEFAKKIFEIKNIKIEINPVTSKQFSQKALRPIII